MELQFKVYVVNLASYNNGETKGDWFDLPLDLNVMYERLFDEDELDESGQPMGDWAIHDFDFPIPFEVSEYCSIKGLNYLIEELENHLSLETEQEIINGIDNVESLLNLADELNLSYLTNDIVPKEHLVSTIKEDIEGGYISSVLYKLSDINSNSVNHDEYFMEHNGNFQSITEEDIDERYREIVSEFQRTA